MELTLLSALDKVFPDMRPISSMPARLSAMRGELVSLQLAYRSDGQTQRARLALAGPAAAWVRARRVRLAPGTVPPHYKTDEGYISTRPGLFPDLLEPFDLERLPLATGVWQAIWLDVRVPDDAPAGDFTLSVRMEAEDGGAPGEAQTGIRVIPCALPKLPIYHTQWFHADCLADYYGVPALGEDWWRIVGNFMDAAAESGVNTLLTPIHTPPLDTAVGGERTCVQLIDVEVQGDTYSFGFDKLRRWIDRMEQAGIQNVEIAHLFTQWGARHAPLVMATKDGQTVRLFGWEADATGAPYAAYLRALLPRLTAKLTEWGLKERTIFHISDEPEAKQLDSYRAARDLAAPLLQGFLIADALSDVAFYKQGVVGHPIPAVDHIEPFLEAGVPGLWCYYCCGQSYQVPNRFMALPSYRNRALGALMYKFGIQGFLHWGFNFYSSFHSLQPINPFVVTDGDGAFPSGDPFLVYPGPGGQPMGSIRQMVLIHALNDLRALALLEALAGREAALALIDQGQFRPIRFGDFPAEPGYFLDLRERINCAIEANVGGKRP